jgi:hypothetical protein
MAFNLIPLPISIIFIIVFGVAWLLVLWKLRKNGKIYSFLFWLSLALLLAVVLLTAIAGITG